MDTLALNYFGEAVGRIPWQDAFTSVFTGRAEVIETYSDRVIRSPRQVFPMPSIIRFVRKMKGAFARGVKFSRRNVYLRDKGRCQYCGVRVSPTDWEIEHVRPKAQRGKTRWENVVVACVPCNQRKGDRTPEAAGMRLRSKPIRPKYLPGTAPNLIWSEGMPSSWRAYFRSVQHWHEALG
jgi:5-methylcytosine-specific restriction endonuclease McrA